MSYMVLRNLFNLHRLMDEVPADTGGGGGGSDDITIDMEAASDAIGADLGLNEGEGTDDLLDGGSATTPPPKEKPDAALAADKAAEAGKQAAERAAAAGKLTDAKKLLTEKKVDFTGKKDDEILALATAQVPAVQPKVLPKAWKKEMDKLWAGLAPEAQAYIEQREAQVEEGFKTNAVHVKYGTEMRSVMQPYEALLTAQGVRDHGQAIKAVMNAHYILSTQTPDERARFMAGLAKNYQVDPAKVVEFFAADPTPQPSAAERALAARVDKMERERTESNTATYNALKAQSVAELDAFASDPKHPYFNEVMGEVALLMQDPKLSLEDAYGRAVYANPVTREKELGRLRKEAEEKTRIEAEAAAKAAEKAKGTRIRGQEQERGSPDLLGSMEDTMRETMKEIKSR